MHPLHGPRLKVERARTEIKRLRALEAVFQDQAIYEVRKAEFNPRTGQYRYRAHVVHSPSLDEWGVWIGEIVHNLRSALDGLVYQLALLNGAPSDIRTTQFPIFRYRFSRTVKGRTVTGFEGDRNAKRPGGGSGRNMIASLRKDHQQAIERLQPYRRKGERALWTRRRLNGRWNLLYRLSELNNADKHRLIQVVGVKSGIGPWVSGWGGDELENEYHFTRRQVLLEGAVVMEASPKMHVDTKVVPLIAFWQGCDAVHGNGVVSTLGHIADKVSAVIEDFGSEFPDVPSG